MALTSKQIIKTLNAHRKELARYRIRRIGLFGSYLKGNAKRGSDIDFLVSFKAPTFDQYIELKFYLEDLFGRKVDLVMEDALKPALRHVKEEARYAEAG